ncbi:hypothetical protein [Streptomyces sp. NPDC051546]|uniref:hypothetical protein n=1 Tax=Streptomyces sp. NPDC051546 TaxID=3365655 RepID=UPI0037A34DFE
MALESWASSEGAAALEHDTSLLIGSDLSDGQIQLLWDAITAGNYYFEQNESGRDLLRRLQAVSRDWQRVHGAVPPETDPQWETPELRNRVLQAVGAAPLSAELSELLASCAQTVSPELAFRLLLRLYLASHIPVAPNVWTEYQEISTCFMLGEEVIEALDFLVED